jgi:hypothetical protein
VTRLEQLAEDRTRMDGLHEKQWGIIDVIDNYGIKLDIKQLLILCNRIAVVCSHTASTLHDLLFCTRLAGPLEHDHQFVSEASR